eukprot:UN16208
MEKDALYDTKTMFSVLIYSERNKMHGQEVYFVLIILMEIYRINYCWTVGTGMTITMKCNLRT